MQMRGNLHRYRVSPVRKKNQMLQGTFMFSYSPVLKNAGYGLLLTLLMISLQSLTNLKVTVFFPPPPPGGGHSRIMAV